MSSDSVTASERAARRGPRQRRGLLQRLCHSLTAVATLTCVASALAGPLSGTAQLQVDAREAPRGILKMHLVLPVRPGPLTLVFPKWLPGRHGPAGPITDLAGPVLHAGGERIAWRRDPIDMYAFHLEVPTGASVVEADFEMLTSPRPDGTVFGLEAPRTATDSLAIIEWHQTVLYPAESNTDELEYQAEVRLPPGWKYATALRAVQQGPDSVRFAPTSLTTLIDSTLLAGRYLETYDLGGSPPVRLHVAADAPAALNLSTEKLAQYRRLVAEARALFGPPHYRHYDFLYALTDQIMPDGLEHHESSDNRSPYRTFLDDDIRRAEANLLPHEYTHSWNGKYRRPVGLATRNYQDPMRTELLWVYEGLTEYLGDVLAARSGLLTPEEFRGELVHDFAGLQTHQQARAWRSLEDDTVAAQLLYVQPRDWAARLRRQEDFYHESALLWLEADTLIRRMSGGRRSLDDFCALFLGGDTAGPAVKPYDFDELVRTLAAIQPYDWRRFWNERIQRAGADVPLAGFVQGGWKPELSAEPSIMHRAHEADDRDLDLRFSLGFYVEEDGTIVDVVPGSPGDLAGLASLERLAAVNGRKWSKEELRDALTASPHGNSLITLLLEKDAAYRRVELHYDGGPREPRLVRVPGSPDLLTLIAQPRAAAAH